MKYIMHNLYISKKKLIRENWQKNNFYNQMANILKNIYFEKSRKETVLVENSLCSLYNFSNMNIGSRYLVANKNPDFISDILYLIIKGITFNKQFSKSTSNVDLCLDFSVNKIKDIGAECLESLLENDKFYKLRFLNLGRCSLGNSGVKVLSKFLPKSIYLTHLILSSNEISDEGLIPLCYSLKNNTTITDIDVSSNEITNEGAHHLGDLLKISQSLKKINLFNNLIETEGFAYFFGCLKENVNCSLEYLDLGINNIGALGIKNLSEILQIRKTQINDNILKIGCGNLETSLNDISEISNKSDIFSFLNESCNSIDLIGQESIKKKNGSNFDFESSPLSLFSSNFEKNVIFDSANSYSDEFINEPEYFSSISKETILVPKIINLKHLNLFKTNIKYNDIVFLSASIRHNYSLEYLNLSNNNLQDSAIKLLSENILLNKCTKIKTLILSNNKITSDGMVYISKLIKSNRTIECLNLSSNNIQGDNLSNLGESLACNDILTSLEFQFNQLGPLGSYHISNGLKKNSSLTILNLYSNNIGHEGANYITQAIFTNKLLKINKLFLGSNNFGDKGAKLISHLMSFENQVKLLDLSNNKIGYIGACNLSKFIVRNKNILVLDLKENNMSNEGVDVIGRAFNLNPLMKKLNCYGNIKGQKSALDGIFLK